MNILRMTAIAGSMVLAASAASANAATDQISVRIQSNELASVDGRHAVLDRIKRAASTACNVGDTMVGYREQLRCKDEVVEKLIRDVNSPDLLAQWQGSEAVRTASRS